jgi:hypothetical protein
MNAQQVESRSTTAPPGRLLPARWDNHSVFTVGEFASIFRLSLSAAYAATAVHSKVMTIRFGRRVLVPRREIERLLAIE